MKGKFNYINKTIYTIFLLLVGGIMGGIFVQAATTIFASNQVGYDNSNTELVSDNVQGALDELYQLSGSSSSCPDGYVCYEKINVLSLFEDNAVRDDTSSTYVTSSSGIIFGTISSDTNGKGIYLRANTANSGHPIYYFRGAVDNNNVIFANYCWKIVRTTETGGIKLVYNGEQNGGKCLITTGTVSGISQGRFNPLTSSDYVGYMYGTNNATSSVAKTTIENWFGTNIENKNSSTGNKYSSYLEDTVWCNDRSMNSSNYTTQLRLINATPNLECSLPADSFTVNSANGNGKLTYPVGLLTTDELVLAGSAISSPINNSSTNTFYLYNNVVTWTMSPHSTYPKLYYLNTTGTLDSSEPSESRLYRPAISLKAGVTFTGDGTGNNPYVVVE